MAEPEWALMHGNHYPYDGDDAERAKHPDSWSYRAARGVLADLLDRRGIRQELEEIDYEIRCEIVSSLAAIIEEASPIGDKDG